MARVTLTPQSLLGPFPSLPVSANALDITFAAADATNKEQFALTGREILVAQNTGAGARTITITSVADNKGRTGDISTYSIGAGETAVFSFFGDVTGWLQSDGMVYIEAEHAEVEWAVLRLP